VRFPVSLVTTALATVLLAGCGVGPDATTPVAVPGSAVPGELTPRGSTVTGVPVERVVDGDTIHVRLDGDDVTVRLIGIDTPETVKPDWPVECYGPEASAYAKRTLTEQTVTLEFDDSQGRTDRYGRTLAYVWLELPGGGRRLFNLDAVVGGFAEERQYGPQPFAWQPELRSAERQAQAAGAGRWGACPQS
jgi:micrococcal nuclease